MLWSRLNEGQKLALIRLFRGSRTRESCNFNVRITFEKGKKAYNYMFQREEKYYKHLVKREKEIYKIEITFKNRKIDTALLRYILQDSELLIKWLNNSIDFNKKHNTNEHKEHGNYAYPIYNGFKFASSPEGEDFWRKHYDKAYKEVDHEE